LEETPSLPNEIEKINFDKKKLLKILTYIKKNDYGLESRDSNGFTPVEYAKALNLAEAVEILKTDISVEKSPTNHIQSSSIPHKKEKIDNPQRSEFLNNILPHLWTIVSIFISMIFIYGGARLITNKKNLHR
jgi:hypothetical protein